MHINFFFFFGSPRGGGLNPLNPPPRRSATGGGNSSDTFFFRHNFFFFKIITMTPAHGSVLCMCVLCINNSPLSFTWHTSYQSMKGMQFTSIEWMVNANTILHSSAIYIKVMKITSSLCKKGLLMISVNCLFKPSTCTLLFTLLMSLSYLYEND